MYLIKQCFRKFYNDLFKVLNTNDSVLIFNILCITDVEVGKVFFRIYETTLYA